jgi:hypothetical protein
MFINFFKVIVKQTNDEEKINYVYCFAISRCTYYACTSEKTPESSPNPLREFSVDENTFLSYGFGSCMLQKSGQAHC